MDHAYRDSIPFAWSSVVFRAPLHPPLNKIAENLMRFTYKRELDHYRDIIKSLL
jgi:hypothetical protein